MKMQVQNIVRMTLVAAKRNNIWSSHVESYSSEFMKFSYYHSESMNLYSHQRWKIWEIYNYFLYLITVVYYVILEKQLSSDFCDCLRTFKKN